MAAAKMPQTTDVQNESGTLTNRTILIKDIIQNVPYFEPRLADLLSHGGSNTNRL